MSRPYPVKRSIEQHIGRFTVVLDTLETGGGERPYSYIRERDFVCVLPVCGDEIVYIRQYRHAIDQWKLEFPCGVIEREEAPEQTAARELLEETGYQADSLIGLGWLHAKAGTSTAKVYLFLARCSPSGTQSLDPAERISLRHSSCAEFAAMVDSGRFDHVYGLVAWYRSIKILKDASDEQEN